MAKRCPNKLTPTVAEDIYALAKRGFTLQMIADAVGISKSSLKSWASQGKSTTAHESLQEFSYRYEAARSAARGDMLEQLIEHGQKDWRALAWALERTTDEFKMKYRMSQAAQERIDELTIEKAEAELEYVRAKTNSLKDGVVSEGDIAEELERIQREHSVN